MPGWRIELFRNKGLPGARYFHQLHDAGKYGVLQTEGGEQERAHATSSASTTGSLGLVAWRRVAIRMLSGLLRTSG